jgi:uncharacterized membrane protein YhaH (DUF805 family)
MFCKKCGNKMEIDDEFCAFCGDVVKKKEVQGTSKVQNTNSTNDFEPYSQSKITFASKAPGRKFLIVSAILNLLLVIVTIPFMLTIGDETRMAFDVMLINILVLLVIMLIMSIRYCNDISKAKIQKILPFVTIFMVTLVLQIERVNTIWNRPGYFVLLYLLSTLIFCIFYYIGAVMNRKAWRCPICRYINQGKSTVCVNCNYSTYMKNIL